MTDETSKPIKIRRISIRNYKGIDKLEMKFPPPRFEVDPDIFVIGSRNGLGKTSIIECCALLLLAPMLNEDKFRLFDRYSMVDVPDLLIRANATFAKISGDLVIGEEHISLEMRIERNGTVSLTNKVNIKNSLPVGKKLLTIPNKQLSSKDLREKFRGSALFDVERDVDELIKAIFGFTSNPVIESNFLLFHSYRKVQEGNPEMGMMVSDRIPRRRLGIKPGYEVPMGVFKLQMLRSLMGQAQLFEFGEEKGSSETIETLNRLVKTYAGGKISKLRPSPNNTIDFRITPDAGKDSFTFDGLSSGQKEIISTLFLIWHHTRNRPSVVFIDEPELHLNAQWHRGFVKSLIDLAPNNQYIIATHSEDVMDSVSAERRALLTSDQDTGQ